MTIADNLTDAATVAGPTGTGRPCKLATILTRLDQRDRDAVTDALQPIPLGGLSDERIAHALRAEHPVSLSTIRRHRLALCGCPTREAA